MRSATTCSRHVRSGDDGDFSEARLDAAWSGELGGQLGNLANRVLVLLSTALGGSVPQLPDSAFVREAAELPAKVAKAFETFELHVGLSEIFAFVGHANRQLARLTPWLDAAALLGDLPSADRQATADRLGSTLSEQVFGLAIVARCLLPFLPRSAVELHEKLGIPLPALYREPLIVDGAKTASAAVLFPRRMSA